MKALTTLDLLKGQSKSDGYGLYGHEIRSPAFWCGKAKNPYRAVEALDMLVVKIANERSSDLDTLFGYMNSKLGRWAGDGIACFPTQKKMREILEMYLRIFLAPPKNFDH